ncbi:isochorismatase family protein [Rhizobium brockwellii]
MITGVMSECCVEDTARQAYQLHYQAVVINNASWIRISDGLLKRNR